MRESSIPPEITRVLCDEAKVAARAVGRKLRLHREDQDDIQQDIIVELVSRIDSYKPARGAPGPFIGKLARHAGGRVANRLRGQKRHYQYLVNLTTGPTANDFQDRSLAVHQALKALTGEEQRLLALLARQTPSEIGHQEGWSRASVYRDRNSLKMRLLLAGVDLKSNNGQ